MSHKGLVFLLLTINFVQAIPPASNDLRSPLDITYIFNDQSVPQHSQDTGLEASRHTIISSVLSPGAKNHHTGFGNKVQSSVHSDTAGDSVFHVDQSQDKPAPSQTEYSFKYDSNRVGLPSPPRSTGVNQPLPHIPLPGSDYGKASYRQIGVNFAEKIPDNHYPIHVPASSSDTGGFVDGYRPIPRIHVPNSYIFNDVLFFEDGGKRVDDIDPHADSIVVRKSVSLVGDYFRDGAVGDGTGASHGIGPDVSSIIHSSAKTVGPWSPPGSYGTSGGYDHANNGGHQYRVVHQSVLDYHDHLQCRPQFFLQYDHDFSGAVWQDVKGHVHVQYGRAVFQGQGFLAIPFFACNDLLPRYSMIFVIRPSYQAGVVPQAVLGNSVFSSQASLLLSLSGHTLTLIIRQRASGLSPDQLLAQCYSHHHRRRRSISSSGSYTGGGGVPRFESGEIAVLQLTISGEATVTIAQENDRIYFSAGDQHVTGPGRLPALTNEALYVGAGADPRGGDALAHYTGTFDSFLFEKCP